MLVIDFDWKWILMSYSAESDNNVIIAHAAVVVVAVVTVKAVSADMCRNLELLVDFVRFYEINDSKLTITSMPQWRNEIVKFENQFVAKNHGLSIQPQVSGDNTQLIFGVENKQIEKKQCRNAHTTLHNSHRRNNNDEANIELAGGTNLNGWSSLWRPMRRIRNWMNRLKRIEMCRTAEKWWQITIDNDDVINKHSLRPTFIRFDRMMRRLGIT